jgi:hypothetical protein
LDPGLVAIDDQLIAVNRYVGILLQFGDIQFQRRA